MSWKEENSWIKGLIVTFSIFLISFSLIAIFFSRGDMPLFLLPFLNVLIGIPYGIIKIFIISIPLDSLFGCYFITCDPKSFLGLVVIFIFWSLFLPLFWMFIGWRWKKWGPDKLYWFWVILPLAIIAISFLSTLIIPSINLQLGGSFYLFALIVIYLAVLEGRKRN